MLTIRVCQLLLEMVYKYVRATRLDKIKIQNSLKHEKTFQSIFNFDHVLCHELISFCKNAYGIS